MKLFLCYWVLFVSIALNVQAADKPEKIEPKTRIIQTAGWYQQQSELWKAVAMQQPQNAQAWLNYYLAARFATASETDIENSIATMSKTCPQSFEYQYITYKQGHDEMQSFPYLQKAYNLQPENPLTYGDFIIHYELTGNAEEKARFCHKWLLSKDLSSGLLSYCYNLLMSVDTGGILVTMGESTTLPLWIVQQAMQVRPDVTVLDLDLLTQATYRQSILAQKKLVFHESDFKDLAASEVKKSIGNHLFANNPNRSFYFSLSLPWSVLNPVQEQLYVVGLASVMSQKRINNIEQIKEKLENQFLLDYVRVDFTGESPQSTAQVLKVNYIAPILLLQTHYQQNGEKTKAAKWQQLAMQLAKDQDKTGEVESYLEQTRIVPLENAKPSPMVVNATQLEKKFKPVYGKLQAQQTEVTNSQYQQFLDYLQQTQRLSDYGICKPDLSTYEGVGAIFMQNYHTPFRTEQKHLSETAKERSFVNHPVVDISYEAANLYCAWLMEQYNNQPERTYAKVKFRLPTLNEWRIAAIAAAKFTNNEPLFENLKLTYTPRKEKTPKEIAVANVNYPWWRVVPQLPYNQFGCYLGNFKVDSSRCISIHGDGFGFTGPVSSYFANDFGLYDMVGNVAEMISDKGKACGGSWNHVPAEATITSVMTYEKPESRVGFRVFMEIIAEKK